MVWKCPKCGHKSQSYTAMQRHYYSKHHKSTAKSGGSKGKSSKTYTFRPTLKKRRK